MEFYGPCLCEDIHVCFDDVVDVDVVVFAIVKRRLTLGLVQRNAQCAFSLRDEFGLDERVDILHLEFNVLVCLQG